MLDIKDRKLMGITVKRKVFTHSTSTLQIEESKAQRKYAKNQ
jgi:hypothetical protein